MGKSYLKPSRSLRLKKMIVNDFNGDGYPDVLVGGNDYSYDVSTGYYDANKGLILMNKGAKREKGNPLSMYCLLLRAGCFSREW